MKLEGRMQTEMAIKYPTAYKNLTKRVLKEMRSEQYDTRTT